jgi:hypothetical protein
VSHAIAQISCNVDLEIKYNPFKGKTLEQLSETIEEELHDLVEELRPDEVACFTTSVSKMELINE